ncbi:MAG: hypothetical protein H3C43_12080 [Leptonema sp. (in: Bacteria)]|nr:hypothetical protein [Leptonema sp. (in: bacteria)]
MPESRQKDLILALDCGTQSIRAIAFDAKGNLLAKSQLPLEYEAAQPGWGEQQPEVFFDVLANTCKQLLNEHPEMKDRVAGITLTTQRGTVINLDENSKPLRPAILWFDKRRCFNYEPVKGLCNSILPKYGRKYMDRKEST